MFPRYPRPAVREEAPRRIRRLRRARRSRAREVRGGTRVLADQAACPFRAFAKLAPRRRAAGGSRRRPDARTRGTLLHALMKFLWERIEEQRSLQKDLEPAIARAADAAVKELELEGRFADLERARLARLGARVAGRRERARPASTSSLARKAQTERRRPASSPARIDRLDKLASGGHALIDYKTEPQSSRRSNWKPPTSRRARSCRSMRVAAQEDITAVAFAQVRTGEMRFMGFSKDKRRAAAGRASQGLEGPACRLEEGNRRARRRLRRRRGARRSEERPRRPAGYCATCRRCAASTRRSTFS